MAPPPTTVEQSSVADQQPVGVSESNADLVPEPSPIDPAAEPIVQAISEAIASDPPSEALITIGLSRIRNHSRCESTELQSALDRLASQLSHAGRHHGLRFTARADEPVQYQMQGTAYLITSEGFDMWEMFLSLRSATTSRMSWSAPGAVNILRQQRPGQPQILLGLNW